MFTFALLLAVASVLLADQNLDEQSLFYTVNYTKPLGTIRVDNPLNLFLVDTPASENTRIEARGPLRETMFGISQGHDEEFGPSLSFIIHGPSMELNCTAVIYHKNDITAIRQGAYGGGDIYRVGRGIVRTDDQKISLHLNRNAHAIMNFSVAALEVVANNDTFCQFSGTVRNNATFLVTGSSFIDLTHLTLSLIHISEPTRRS